MKEGKIVPVEITCSLVRKAMQKVGGTVNYFFKLFLQKNSYLIDGFPRNKENLDGWLKFFGDSSDIIGVLFLECEQEICTDRIQLRSQKSGRIDDNHDSLKKRFDVFFNETMENYSNLEKISKVIRINATSAPQIVFESIVFELDKLYGN